MIRTCAAFNVRACTTEDPGVWIAETQSKQENEATTRKVCAIGVQVSRGVTTHGVGLNVTDRLGKLSWGFERIVACGLEGKTVTWLSREGAGDVDVDGVAEVFAREVARGLKVDGVQRVTREEIEAEAANEVLE